MKSFEQAQRENPCIPSTKLSLYFCTIFQEWYSFVQKKKSLTQGRTKNFWTGSKGDALHSDNKIAIIFMLPQHIDLSRHYPLFKKK